MKKIIASIIAVVLFLFILVLLQRIFSNEAKTTVYSPLYNEDTFMSISKGMVMDDVVRLLGPPLLIHTITEEGRRGVIFDQTVLIQEYLDSVKRGKVFPNKNVKNEFWSYSKQKTSTSDYYVRKIVFNNSGGVVDKVFEVYHD